MSGQKLINSRFANQRIFPYIFSMGQAREIFLSVCHEGLLVQGGASLGVSSMYGYRPYSTANMNILLCDVHVM